MWRRTPGPYMCVHDASTAMAMNSITFGSSARDSIGFRPMVMKASVQAGSSW